MIGFTMPSSERYPYHPTYNPDVEPYWEGVRRGELLYQVCDDCGEAVFHPRAMCPYCMGSRLAFHKSCGSGRIYSFTIQYFSASDALRERLPYALGIVEMQEGYYMFAEIVPADPDRLRVGAPVDVWFDKVDVDLVLPKFRLAIDGTRDASPPRTARAHPGDSA